MPSQQEQKEESIRVGVLQKTLELFTSALSLVAALAWNDAIQSLFKMFFGDAASLWLKFIYAIIITIIIVVMSFQVSRLNKLILAKRAKEQNTNTPPLS